jgi:hypothetical protein
VENAAILGMPEVSMARLINRVFLRSITRTTFSNIEIEPLLGTNQAATLPRIHPKTLQKTARRGEIRGSTRRQGLAIPYL